MSKKRKHSQKKTRTAASAVQVNKESKTTQAGERAEETQIESAEEIQEEPAIEEDNAQEEENEEILSPEAGQSELFLKRQKENKKPKEDVGEPGNEEDEEPEDEEEDLPSPEAGQSKAEKEEPEYSEGDGGKPGSKKSILALAILSFVLIGGSILLPFVLAPDVYPENPLSGGTEDHDWQGDRVYLGSYEQDNDMENGKEPILWRVLSINEEKMLLLSEYALDVRRYHDVNEEVTWETCEVRKWLNGEFFETAFADRGKWLKDYIPETKCETAANQRFGTDGGKATKDRVFLPAWEDTYQESYGFPEAFTRESDITNKSMQYGEVCLARVCYPTMYAMSGDPLVTRIHDTHVDPFGLAIDGFGSVHWLLRTPGADQTYGTNVSRWGRTTYNFFSPVDHDESTVRPMVWVDIRELKFGRLKNGYFYAKEDREYKKECEGGLDYKELVQEVLTNEPVREAPKLAPTDKTEISKLSDPVKGGNAVGDWEGDRVYFGSYKDDPVLWRVLSTKDGKLMLLSEYGIEERHFDKASKEVYWIKSSVRKWMNENMLAEMFTPAEQEAILLTKLENKANPRYGTKSGEETEDKAFLLSWEDCINEDYGFTGGEGKEKAPTESNSRICYEEKPNTEKAIYGKTDLNGNRIYSDWQLAVNWMLRTAGSRDGYISDVNIYGDVYRHEKRKASKKMWVRPAIVLQKDLLLLDKKDGDDFPTILVKE